MLGNVNLILLMHAKNNYNSINNLFFTKNNLYSLILPIIKILIILICNKDDHELIVYNDDYIIKKIEIYPEIKDFIHFTALTYALHPLVDLIINYVNTMNRKNE